MRRLKDDQLIASNAGAAIRERAYTLSAHWYRRMAKIEHDEIVAEPVHLEKRDLGHSAAYMAPRPTLSNAAAAGALVGPAGLRQPSFVVMITAPAWRAPDLPCFAVWVFAAAGNTFLDVPLAEATLTVCRPLLAALACVGAWEANVVLPFAFAMRVEWPLPLDLLAACFAEAYFPCRPVVG